MSVALLILTAAFGLAPPAAGEIREFEGGVLDGLRFRRTASEDGNEGFEMLPALPGKSPPSAALAERVEALIHAFRSGNRADFDAVSAPDAQMALALDGCRLSFEVSDAAPCEPQPLYEVSFGPECVAGAPYQMPGDVIRVEWSCGQRLAYISWFTFTGDRVTSGELQPASVPRFLGS
jgi:hypothetical protein